MSSRRRADNGRYYIRENSETVACDIRGKPWYTTNRAKAEASIMYLAMSRTERAAAPVWLHSTWGLE